MTTDDHAIVEDKNASAATPKRARSALKWEITSILVVKIAIILLAGFTIFGASHRVHVDTAKMTDKILSRS